MHSEMTVH